MINIYTLFIEKPALFPIKFDMTILDRIVAQKKERLASAKYRTPLTDLKAGIRDVEPPRDFTGALKRGHGKIRFITEIKKASPSRGIIRQDFNHLAIAAIYESKAVDAVSVITEEDFFLGNLDYLRDVKKEVARPVLRKDFIFDEYQIYEARLYGADALLLMASVVDKGQAEEYLHMSRELGMAVLFEVHDAEELEIALQINTPVIGINNRDLKTLSIDLNTTLNIRKEIPADRVVVSESGIRTREDVLRLEAADIDAILVGTCLMEAEEIGGKIDQLRGS